MGLVCDAIEVDYQAAVRKSNELYSLGEQLEKMINTDMAEIEQQIRSGWKGDARDEYMRKHELVKRKLLKHARALKAEARQLKTIADNINRIEEYGIGLLK